MREDNGFNVGIEGKRDQAGPYILSGQFWITSKSKGNN